MNYERMWTSFFNEQKFRWCQPDPQSMTLRTVGTLMNDMMVRENMLSQADDKLGPALIGKEKNEEDNAGS